MNIRAKRKNFLCYLYLMFLVGAFGGWLYEEIFYRVTEGAWTDRGVLYGPWLPIYGIGIVVFYFLKPFKKNPVLLFFLCAGLAGIWEYLVGFFCLQWFGVRLWDYRTAFANIGGLVCLRSVLSFGAFGLLFHYLVEPTVERVVAKRSERVLYTVCLVTAGLFLLDLVLSYLSRRPITY